MSFLQNPFPSWKSQHRKDLHIYRSAHQEWRNRMLHWMFIPLESASLIWFAMALLPFWLPTLVTLGLGVVALGIATYPVVGFVTFLFHIAVVLVGQWMVQSYSMFTNLIVDLVLWTLAWSLQVGVGHWILEGNQPNVANIETVSFLAMVQSVLIAWSS